MGSQFLDLPLELRFDIYKYLLCPEDGGPVLLYASEHSGLKFKKDRSNLPNSKILYVCKQIYKEAIGILYARNKFEIDLRRPLHLIERQYEPGTEQEHVALLLMPFFKDPEHGGYESLETEYKRELYKMAENETVESFLERSFPVEATGNLGSLRPSFKPPTIKATIERTQQQLQSFPTNLMYAHIFNRWICNIEIISSIDDLNGLGFGKASLYATLDAVLLKKILEYLQLDYSIDHLDSSNQLDALHVWTDKELSKHKKFLTFSYGHRNSSHENRLDDQGDWKEKFELNTYLSGKRIMSAIEKVSVNRQVVVKEEFLGDHPNDHPIDYIYFPTSFIT